VPPLRVAVIGTGAFGRNHLRVYRELQTAHPDLVYLAALVEPDPARRDSFAAQYDIPAFASVAELLATMPGGPLMARPHRDMGGVTTDAPIDRAPIDAASICVPTIHHASVAADLLTAGIDILIEKPFAATLAEADNVVSLARDHSRIVAIGHLERFNPAVTATLAALNKPMFFEAHRLSIFTPRSLDVDVVLDLMIHDLDIVLSLTKSPVREVRAVGLPVLSRKTDIANVRIEFESGCIANFTASRVSTEQVRKLRLFQPHQYLSLDFARQELLTISVDPAILNQLQMLSSRPEAALFAAAAERPATLLAQPLQSGVPNQESHPTPGLSLTKSDIPKGEPLRLELEDFLHAVRTRTSPRVPAEAGRAALALALEINQQIASHAQRAGLA
jgi:predicted dehydrogenase